nr:uncharacterized protein LOC124810119 [Hydra vulgaris]
MHKPHLTKTDLRCSKFNVMEIMLTNFLNLEVKPSRHIQIHVMQRYQAEAVVPSCSKKDGLLFWSTCVHAMKATYNNFSIIDSCNKLRNKRVKVTGDKEVCAGFNFTT